MPNRKLAAGNWKMNGLSSAVAELDALIAGTSAPVCDVLICPPATLLSAFAARADGSAVSIGAQDCHANQSGAHTGDISAGMIADSGASHVLVGHSERRTDHAESSALVRTKAEAAIAAGLVAIVCIGETEAERDAGKALDVIAEQLSASVPDDATSASVVVAYEPVWAIGTGRTPTLEQIGEVHGAVRSDLEKRFGPDQGAAMRILYGGSVKPGNAAEIFGIDNVDGGLVGGASLKAEDFLGIIAAAG